MSKKFLSGLKVPRYVNLVEGDNTLLIDTHNLTCIQLLLEECKSYDYFILEEFLQAKEGKVKSDNGYFTNQFIFGLYNHEKLSKT